MKVSIDLPQVIDVDDYHEFGFLEDILADLGINPKVKMKEVGFDGRYIGIAYVGNLKDRKNKVLLETLRKRVNDYDREFNNLGSGIGLIS